MRIHHLRPYAPGMLWLYGGFLLLVVFMLALDLGVFHRKSHAVSVREALIWSAIWISLSLCFTAFVYLIYTNHWFDIGLYTEGSFRARHPQLYPDTGGEAALMYLTGYVTEWSLSVDNIFVIALIFGAFKIPPAYQHRVLFWGILGAVVMRGIFILVGAELIERVHWVIYVFGAFLVITAIRLLMSSAEEDPREGRLVRWAYKLLPVTDRLHGEHFLIRRSELARDEKLHDVAEAGEPEKTSKVDVPRTTPPIDEGERNRSVGAATKAGYVLTPLGLALIIVEATDVLFAVDSIPAIFGITGDRFLIFTSNIFAILGLRAMYFALAGIIRKFRFLQPALALILGFIGVKMLLSGWLHEMERLASWLPYITLAVIVLSLAGGVVASMLFPPATEAEEESAEPGAIG